MNTPALHAARQWSQRHDVQWGVSWEDLVHAWCNTKTRVSESQLKTLHAALAEAPRGGLFDGVETLYMPWPCPGSPPERLLEETLPLPATYSLEEARHVAGREGHVLELWVPAYVARVVETPYTTEQHVLLPPDLTFVARGGDTYDITDGTTTTPVQTYTLDQEPTAATETRWNNACTRREGSTCTDKPYPFSSRYACVREGDRCLRTAAPDPAQRWAGDTLKPREVGYGQWEQLRRVGTHPGFNECTVLLDEEACNTHEYGGFGGYQCQWKQDYCARVPEEEETPPPPPDTCPVKVAAPQGRKRRRLFV